MSSIYDNSSAAMVAAVPGGSWTLLTDTLLHRAGDDQRDPTRRSADPDRYDAVVAEARAAFEASLAGSSAFAALVARAGLELEEAEVFAALCAVEVDPARQRLVAAIADDPAQRRVSLSMLARLFGPDHLGPVAVSSDARLSCAGLIDVAPASTWSNRLVGPAERVTWHLVGDNSIDPQLPLDLDVVFGNVGDSGERVDGQTDAVVVVVGADQARRLQTAVTELRGSAFLVCQPPDRSEAWRAIVREATISDAGVIVCVHDELPLDARHWIERTPHLAWSVTAPTLLPIESLPRRPWREVTAPAPHVHPDEIHAAFPDGSAADVAGRRLTAHQLRMVSRAADGVGGPSAALRRLAAGPIEKLARRIRPRVGWDDLVLPADVEDQIRELVDRYRYRSLVHDTWGASPFPSPGVVALFAGASGTGKTTAAEVVSGELGVDMFKIDLSSVVSKYIGETEKNLEELFSAAESGDMVLCFDEADALLGKRSEVSDARDRYANLEVSYLLQRMETYDGFVVLTTNMQANIDQAFLRRIHGRVSFPNPSPAERRQIWQRSLADVPTSDLDLDFLADRFDLVGGAIRNAALSGAFFAAAAGSPLTTELAILGLKREFQKQGKMITRELFGEWYPLVASD